VTWYLTDLARYRSEREGLEGLGSQAAWLTPVGWRVDNAMRLILDAEIVVGEVTYPVYLRYPAHFPHTPPSVFPRDEKSRWSNHQFGVGGELCLEFGPDNWTPDLTGAQMLESAYRLLAGENPSPGETAVVASRHVDSLGQMLRRETLRFLVTRNLNAFFADVPVGATFTGNLLAAFRKPRGAVYFIDKIALADGAKWEDQSIPASLGYELFERPVAIFRIAADAALPPTISVEEFKASCVQYGCTTDANYVVILCGVNAYAYSHFGDAKEVIEVAVVPPDVEARRLDESHDLLKEKSVALVGCGSLGSKIATMLARCGIGRFFLVDDDLLMPDNLVRNELDWRDMGFHKVDGVARRTQYVNPSVKTSVRRIQLAGLESSGSAETAIMSLSECDLIIDATANPNVLNLISAVAASAKKPILWAEVFGGGIGGLIARCRPELEPPPQYMRRAIENWFEEQGAPPVRATRDYGTGGEGAPLLADDADVSAIAAPAARLAIDTLLAREPSLFPHSAYTIGLAPGSVFSQPFQTFPIETGAHPVLEPEKTLSADETSAELDRIIRLFAPK
jgi:hypothetical protein